MKIRRAETKAFCLPLASPVVTAHGQLRTRSGFLIRLFDEDGHVGHGEATPMPEFGTETRAMSDGAIQRAMPRLVGDGGASLEDSLARVAQVCVGQPCSHAAIDAALHELAAKRAGLSLPSWFRRRAKREGPPASRLQVQAIVPGADPADVHASATSLVKDGFETFKLKLATAADRGDLGRDRERVAALREAIGPTGRIRLDANEAWDVERALSAAAMLACFDIDYLEQPIARDDLTGLKTLNEESAVPVAADEALLDSGWAHCLAERVASIFILKPAALGGIDTTLTLAARAQDEGIRVVWSSLMDGVVSRKVAVGLAAAFSAPSELPDVAKPAALSEAHGLGTAGLLARDLVDAGPTEVEQGWIRLGEAPGLDWPVDRMRDGADGIWGNVETFGVWP